MLTAAHCDGPGLRTNNGPAEVIVKDTAKDLLFLKVVENCPCASISDEPLKFADEVMAIGFPNALLKAGSPGKYYGHFNDPNYPQFHGFSVFSMVTEGGYSGGGIFNKYGDLVGLVSAGSKSLTIGSSQQMIKDVLNGRQ
jgi:S1-C subfamily serine protease